MLRKDLLNRAAVSAAVSLCLAGS